MLKNTDGNLYGAWPHLMVTNNVNQGQTHDFTFYVNDPLRTQYPAPSIPSGASGAMAIGQAMKSPFASGWSKLHL